MFASMSLATEEILRAGPVAVDAGEEIGRSRDGRAIRGFRIGSGPLRVSLIAGCHADEPVGPWTLRRLVAHLLSSAPEAEALRARAAWTVIPHVNPDGEARNRAWSGDGGCSDLDRGFDPLRYLRDAVRELPGDDVEFGFPRSSDGDDPGVRPENLSVARFLRESVAGHGPFHLHASLHGMAWSGGPWFLVEGEWRDRIEPMRRRLVAAVRDLGYALHDVDRRGEKGFHRIARGFCTRPDSRAMRRHFVEKRDPVTAQKFRPSSMEYVRSLGGDPLTLVPEMPLFVVEGAGEVIEPVDPVLDRFRREHLPRLREAAASGDPTAGTLPAALGIRPMPVADQMRLQLRFVESGCALSPLRSRRRCSPR